MLVTHDPVDALTLVPQVAVLEAGRVVQAGAPDDVRRRPRLGLRGLLRWPQLPARRLSRPGPTARRCG